MSERSPRGGPLILVGGDAREKIEHWRQEYNTFQSHSSLGGLILDEVGLGNKKRTDDRPIFNL